jgi:hypothetical protein
VVSHQVDRNCNNLKNFAVNVNVVVVVVFVVCMCKRNTGGACLGGVYVHVKHQRLI